MAAFCAAWSFPFVSWLAHPHSSSFSFSSTSAWKLRSHRGIVVRDCVLRSSSVQNRPELVRECIQKLSYSTGVLFSRPDHHFRLTGEQRSLGLNGEWTLCWCMDGRYYEKFHSHGLTHECGFDALHDAPWHADYAGRVTPMQLDDLEITHFSLFLRTGFWLTEKGLELLNIQLEGEKSVNAIKQQIGEVVLSINFKGKKVVASVYVDACQWLPLAMEMKILGQIERWEYGDWRSIDGNLKQKYPFLCARCPGEGGKDSYKVLHSAVGIDSHDITGDKMNWALPYSYPETRLIPRYNKYYPQVTLDHGFPRAVKLVRATGGQLLVKPVVNGIDIGYFVLDTGAGGLAICPKKAEELKMDAFGEVFVTGFHGQVKSQFRRGQHFQLGCLKIESPIFVEVDMQSLIVGQYSAVGVCGFDVLQHCIVEISCLEERVSFYNTSEFEEISGYSLQWQSFSFLQNVPNIPVKINGEETLLLLDTGASGTGVIFHSKAKKYTDMIQMERCTNIRGIKSEGDRSEEKMKVQVMDATIKRMEVAGHIFENVGAIYLSPASCKLQLSHYTSGILCMDVLASFRLVFDYLAQRIALAPPLFSHQNR